MSTNLDTGCVKLGAIEIEMCPSEWVNIALKHGTYLINDMESKQPVVGNFFPFNWREYGMMKCPSEADLTKANLTKADHEKKLSNVIEELAEEYREKSRELSGIRDIPIRSNLFVCVHSE